MIFNTFQEVEDVFEIFSSLFPLVEFKDDKSFFGEYFEMKLGLMSLFRSFANSEFPDRQRHLIKLSNAFGPRVKR